MWGGGGVCSSSEVSRLHVYLLYFKVSGNGVIGMYPDLQCGGEAFIYESCTSLVRTPGTMQGHFLFRKHDGTEIVVAVAPFDLVVPPYLY